jgi:hypothetical protein
MPDLMHASGSGVRLTVGCGHSASDRALTGVMLRLRLADADAVDEAASVARTLDFTVSEDETVDDTASRLRVAGPAGLVVELFAGS